jgi:tRNA/tmRNA/rRNA uracil-C5-methylase (TrmA/RlmC/RlmD family)
MAKENVMLKTLKIFENRGYRVSKVKIIYMFPNNGHYEVILKLEKR